MLIQPKDPEGLRARLTERPLALFGMGGMGAKIIAYCDAHHIPIACLADNNTEKQEQGQDGRKVLSPQEMRAAYPNANVLISSAVFFHEIKKQLEDLGVPADQILSYTLFIAENITWTALDQEADWKRMRMRNRDVAMWIDENVHSVIDYGAGEMFLKTLLPAGCAEYYPIDYIRRSDETIVCDLNAGDFPDISADVAVLTGILEFVTTSESLLRHVSATTKQKIILSYMTLEKFPDIEGRRISAYVNHFTEQEVIDLMAQNGFALKEHHPDPSHEVNTLFLFERV